MGRPAGAPNIQPFGKRALIETRQSKDILHLASLSGPPLERFLNGLGHASNYIEWLVERHNRLIELYSENRKLTNATPKKGPAGPKSATYKKYLWYAEQLVLLEAINSFEVFYKRTLIELAVIVQEFVTVDRIRAQIDARVLWGFKGSISVPALVFEGQLFHDPENINDACKMLLGSGKARYNASDPKKKELVRCLRAIFQLRHTISHNAAVVTASDAAKFKALGYDVSVGAVIDPTKNSLSEAIFRHMKQEAREFTSWLRGETIVFLQLAISERNLRVAKEKQPLFKELLGGTDVEWAAVCWT